jgi:hypothetical protein
LAQQQGYDQNEKKKIGSQVDDLEQVRKKPTSPQEINVPTTSPQEVNEPTRSQSAHKKAPKPK